jgi:hypothetical protein
MFQNGSSYLVTACAGAITAVCLRVVLLAGMQSRTQSIDAYVHMR